MRFLFISSILSAIGGTETLIARMSKWLSNEGHEVVLLVNNAHGNRELFDASVRIIDAGDVLFDLCFPHRAKQIWPRFQIEPPDVIKTFDLTSAWIGLALAATVAPTTRVLFGNYLPSLFPTGSNPLNNHTLRLLLLQIRRSLKDDSILCMNREQITEFRRNYGRLREPIFWPLPIEDPAPAEFRRRPAYGRIVSIGRLDPMKEYNLYMVDVIYRLRGKGFPVTLEIYGDGSLTEEVKARVRARGLAEVIQIKGRVPYSQLSRVLEEAYLFVGMGTSIIEASMCGVPGVVALAYDTEGLTYGPLYNFSFGNAGDRMSTAPAMTVEAEIERLLKLSPYEYEAECRRTQDYARQYDMHRTMNRFMQIVRAASPPKPKQALFCLYYIDSWINRIMKKAPPGASPAFFQDRRIGEVARL